MLSDTVPTQIRRARRQEIDGHEEVRYRKPEDQLVSERS
jgi:hypothetical protein